MPQVLRLVAEQIWIGLWKCPDDEGFIYSEGQLCSSLGGSQTSSQHSVSLKVSTCGAHLHPAHKTASLTPVYTGTNVCVLCVQVVDNKSSDVQPFLPPSLVIKRIEIWLWSCLSVEVRWMCVHQEGGRQWETVFIWRCTSLCSASSVGSNFTRCSQIRFSTPTCDRNNLAGVKSNKFLSTKQLFLPNASCICVGLKKRWSMWSVKTSCN